MKYLFFVLLFVTSSSFAQNKSNTKLFIGINFPGAGFSVWKMKSNFYDRDRNLLKYPFWGNGINVNYGIDLLFCKNKWKFGIFAGQEFIHIHKFINKKHERVLIPIFESNEQTHFHKLLLELEYEIRSRTKNTSLSVNIQGGPLLAERLFIHEYVKAAFNFSLSPVFSYWVSDRVYIIFRLSLDYKFISHKVKQETYSTIMLSQNNPDKLLKNSIYSLNFYSGMRVNLLKIDKYPVKNPRYSF